MIFIEVSIPIFF